MEMEIALPDVHQWPSRNAFEPTASAGIPKIGIVWLPFELFEMELLECDSCRGIFGGGASGVLSYICCGTIRMKTITSKHSNTLKSCQTL